MLFLCLNKDHIIDTDRVEMGAAGSGTWCTSIHSPTMINRWALKKTIDPLRFFPVLRGMYL